MVTNLHVERGEASKFQVTRVWSHGGHTVQDLPPAKLEILLTMTNDATRRWSLHHLHHR